jgi:tetratricopeptide (TPR) repeat protein
LSTLSADRSSTISENRGVDPRRLGQVIRGELDWIVMKAMEKDPSRRYESASAFAADIQRYLNDELVQACPPSALYKVKKFALRNKTLVAATVAVTLALSAGTTISLWQAYEAKKARELAEQKTGLALTVTMSMFDDIEWLNSTPGVENIAEAYIQRGLQLYQEMEKNADDDDIDFFLGRLSAALARLYLGQGEYKEARKVASQSLGHFKRHAQQHTFIPSVYQPIADTHCIAGMADEGLGNDESAHDSYNRAIEISERLIKSYPDDLFSLDGLCQALDCQHKLIRSMGHHDDAVLLSRRVNDLVERISTLNSRDAGVLFRLGRSLHNLAGSSWNRGEFEKAREQLRQAIEAQEEALKLRPNYKDARLGLGFHNAFYGTITLGPLNSPAEAEPFARKAAEIHRQLTRDFPAEREPWLQLADACSQLVDIHRAFDQLDKATAANLEASKALTVLKDRFPDDRRVNWELSFMKMNSTELFFDARDLEEALEQCTDAESLLRVVSASNAPRHLRYHLFSLSYMALILRDLGRVSEVPEIKQRALEIRTRIEQRDMDDLTASSRMGQAWGRYRIGRAFGSLAVIHAVLEEYDVAIELLNDGIRLQQQSYDEQSTNKAFRKSLSEHYSQLSYYLASHPQTECRQYDRALEAAQKAVDLNAKDESAWANQGMAQYRLGQIDPAIESLTKADELSKGKGGLFLFTLAMAHWQQEQPEKARDCLSKAINWLDQYDPERHDPVKRRLEEEANDLIQKVSDADS